MCPTYLREIRVIAASFRLANVSSAWEVTSIACRSESTFEVSKQTDSWGEQMFGEKNISN